MRKKANTNTLNRIPVKRVLLNPMQPRKVFDELELQELAASIREHDVIQPIVVEECGDDFILHDGERRWRAACIAGLKTIPAVVTPPLNGTGPQERLERALVANVQRVDMHPIEEGLAYQRLATEFGLSIQEIAKRTGKAYSHVHYRLQLLTLETEIQMLMLSRKLPCADTKILAAFRRIPAGKERIQLATALAERNATANMIVNACHRYHLAKRATKKSNSNDPTPAMEIVQEKENPEWDALYQLGRVPPWPVITEAVMATCDNCPVRSIANETTCGECGLVIGLKRMMEMANVH
jgi:ParB family chromosome partitioning protein